MICDFENENNDVLHICNTNSGEWVLKKSKIGKRIISNIDISQPVVINTIINGKARVLTKIGHNNYALITNHQPNKLYTIHKDRLNKKYCGNNSNIYDMINYMNHFNYSDINPYKYRELDNRYNCLKKGIYINKNNNL